MRVLFLDFDGVLNTLDLIRSSHQSSKGKAESGDTRWLSMLCPNRVAILDLLCKRASCKVVVSSSWRVLHSKEKLQFLLEKKGFTGEITDVTPPREYGEQRGNVIQRWMESYREENPGVALNVVILDDNSDMAHLSYRLVQTKTNEGITHGHIEKALKLFNEI